MQTTSFPVTPNTRSFGWSDVDTLLQSDWFFNKYPQNKRVLGVGERLINFGKLPVGSMARIKKRCHRFRNDQTIVAGSKGDSRFWLRAPWSNGPRGILGPLQLRGFCSNRRSMFGRVSPKTSQLRSIRFWMSSAGEVSGGGTRPQSPQIGKPPGAC